MKTHRGVREHDTDELRKAKRLEPLHKSGKERHSLYRSFEDEDDEPMPRIRRESAFDYLDDGDEI